ncbi:MAG: hypothetical protein KBC98_00780 [Candidatus Pacebacteria bacterium]|jgi:hypothetical protein|nr:hypothetical protein [Candidatus Paceibacterota bacterium]
MKNNEIAGLVNLLNQQFGEDKKIFTGVEFVQITENGVEQISTGKESLTLLAYKESWRNKVEMIGDMIARGGSTIDVASILAPKNTGIPSDYFKAVTVTFMTPNLTGQIELLKERRSNVFVKDFTIATFHLSFASGKKSLCEIGASWEAGLRLCAQTIKDFQRNPKIVEEERFK